MSSEVKKEERVDKAGQKELNYRSCPLSGDPGKRRGERDELSRKIFRKKMYEWAP